MHNGQLYGSIILASFDAKILMSSYGKLNTNDYHA